MSIVFLQKLQTRSFFARIQLLKRKINMNKIQGGYKLAGLRLFKKGLGRPAVKYVNPAKHSVFIYLDTGQNCSFCSIVLVTFFPKTSSWLLHFS